MSSITTNQNYKQTNIGTIPEDWEVRSLGEIADIDKENLDSLTPLNYELKYISLENVNQGFLTGYSELLFQQAPSRARRKIKKNNILVSTVRPNLKSHLHFTSQSKDWIASTGFAVLECKKEISDSQFIFNHFFGDVINRQIENLTTGSNYPAISSREVKNLQIPLPPLPEQIAIATVLSDTDELITSLTQLIVKKKLIKIGAMQKLLKPQEGWEVRKLGDIGEIITGSTPKTEIKEYWNGVIPWITPTDIDNNQKNINQSERLITQSGLDTVRKLPANTLLVTCIASIGKNAILRENGACNQQINAIIPNSDNSVDFLYYLIDNSKQKLIGSAGITATLMISKKEFAEILFSFPPTYLEQTQIATILTDMDEEIQALESKLSKYRLIKQGMMQELLTGRIRLV
jgi:type I restriction enzyme, S subunit